MTTRKTQKIMVALVIGVAASVIAVILYENLRPPVPAVCRVEIKPRHEGRLLKIEGETLRKAPNKDGILFIRATVTTGDYDGPVVVEVQPDDDPIWHKQEVQKGGKGVFVSRIQLGSKKWPIRGGEGYLMRASAGRDIATAAISVEEVPRGSKLAD